MSEHIDNQTKENDQITEQNDAQQEVKAELIEQTEKQVQPIIIPLQIMPCFYTGPFNDAPTKVAEEPVKEEEELVDEKVSKVRFSRVETKKKDKKPKENSGKKKPLQIVCASLLVLVCACMFALSFCGVVEADVDNFSSSGVTNLGLKLEFSAVDLIDGMIATTYDFQTTSELYNSNLGERIEKCENEMLESLENDSKSGSGNTLSDKTKKLVVKYTKLHFFGNLSFEWANGSAGEVHFILAGVMGLIYIAISATMLALSIAWLVFVCKSKESNLGRVAVCMSTALLVVIIMLLIHMMGLGSTSGFSLAITCICALAICGGVLLFALIYGIVRAPKGERCKVAIKTASAVLVLSVLAFAFAPVLVHIVSFGSTTMEFDTGIGALEETVMPDAEIDYYAKYADEYILSSSKDITGYLSKLDEKWLNDQFVKMSVVEAANNMIVQSLAFHSAKNVEVFSLGYFMVFVVAVISAICLALVFDFVLGGKNHQKAELALKVMIAILTLFMLAIYSSAIGIVNAEYKDANVENMAVTVGYGIVMVAVMSLFSLALDSVVVGLANKKAKAVAIEEGAQCNPYQLESATA